MSLFKSLSDTPEAVFLIGMAAFGAVLNAEVKKDIQNNPHPVAAQVSSGTAASNYSNGSLTGLTLPALPPDGYKRLDWASYPQGGSLDERIDWALKKN